MNLPAFRLFNDLFASEGGHGGIEALGAVAGKPFGAVPPRRVSLLVLAPVIPIGWLPHEC